jgi:hypothetical protein
VRGNSVTATSRVPTVKELLSRGHQVSLAPRAHKALLGILAPQAPTELQAPQAPQAPQGLRGATDWMAGMG